MKQFGKVVSSAGGIIVPKLPPTPPPIIMEQAPLWKLACDSGYFVRLAGLMGASAVALGAYGAHGNY